MVIMNERAQPGQTEMVGVNTIGPYCQCFRAQHGVIGMRCVFAVGCAAGCGQHTQKEKPISRDPVICLGCEYHRSEAAIEGYP